MNIKTLELKNFNIKNVLMLVGSVLLCEAVGVISILLSKIAMTDVSLIWYNILFKPALNPSSEVFVSICAIMYLLMGIALSLVLTTPTHQNDDNDKKQSLIIFGTMLVLSTLVVPVFFGFESALGALIVAFLLWSSIFLCFYKFYKISIPAAVLISLPAIWAAYLMGLTLTYWLVNDLHWMMP